MKKFLLPLARIACFVSGALLGWFCAARYASTTPPLLALCIYISVLLVGAGILHVIFGDRPNLWLRLDPNRIDWKQILIFIALGFAVVIFMVALEMGHPPR